MYTEIAGNRSNEFTDILRLDPSLHQNEEFHACYLVIVKASGKVTRRSKAWLIKGNRATTNFDHFIVIARMH